MLDIPIIQAALSAATWNLKNGPNYRPCTAWWSSYQVSTTSSTVPNKNTNKMDTTKTLLQINFQPLASLELISQLQIPLNGPFLVDVPCFSSFS